MVASSPRRIITVATGILTPRKMAAANIAAMSAPSMIPTSRRGLKHSRISRRTSARAASWSRHWSGKRISHVRSRLSATSSRHSPKVAFSGCAACWSARPPIQPTPPFLVRACEHRDADRRPGRRPILFRVGSRGRLDAPVLDLLRSVSPTFREIPHQFEGRHVTSYVDRSGFRVEFLTPNTGSDDHDGVPALMPAPGGASAQPLRFLDFLTHDPVRAVLLHGAGVPILVPAPARYAVYKLIVSSRRRADRNGTERPSVQKRAVGNRLRTLRSISHPSFLEHR